MSWKRNRSARWAAVAAGWLVLLGGCQPGTAPESALQTEPGAIERQQRTMAEQARNRLFSELTGALGQAMAGSGLGAAIAVCSERAPELARQVSGNGVQIGRTSFRLRNPANQPPEWAREAVAAQSGELVARSLPDGRMGYLFPIRVTGTCLVCHGVREQLSDEVVTVLAERYPADQATGFRDGDLRGWFWVEVDRPAAAGKPDPGQNAKAGGT